MVNYKQENPFNVQLNTKVRQDKNLSFQLYSASLLFL